MSNLPYAKKALGQHWLEDEASLKSMTQSANLNASDIVFEIGPGTGTLTDVLISTNARIIALEFDKQRFIELKNKYLQNKNINIEYGDIRKYDLTKLPKNYKIIANIPYYLTANLLRILADTKNKPQTAVLLVQKEVAKMVVAKSGNLSRVAIFTQIYYQPELGKLVPSILFTPSPKVDSQILKLTRRGEPLIKITESIKKLIKAGFEQKRKKLSGSLASGLGISKHQVECHLQDANIDLNSRAQELTITQWQELDQKIRFVK